MWTAPAQKAAAAAVTMAMNRHLRLFALGLLLAAGARHAPAAATTVAATGPAPLTPEAAARPPAFTPPTADAPADSDAGWAARPRGLEIALPANVPTRITTGPVPEPEDWTMFITGFFLAGLAIRRRKVVNTHNIL